jgi:hypothetical protein
VLVALSSIRADVQAQPRGTINTDIIAEYSEAMILGAEFPPLIVFRDGDKHWLADGFHRFYAYQGCERTEVECDVREGDLRDATLYSAGANAAHGLRRTNEDKRRAVMKLLSDSKWVKWSDHDIARRCAVSQPFVGSLRPARPADTNNGYQYEPRTFTHSKTGKPTTMNTASIGRRDSREEPPTLVPRAQADGEEDRRIPINMTQGDTSIYDNLSEIERCFERLPGFPQIAAMECPHRLRHVFNADRFAEIGEWFLELSKAWKESINVAAE